MECFPKCKTCTGLCETRPSLPPVNVTAIGKATTNRSIPRPQAIDESMRSGDFLLSCDHFTSYEEIIIFEVFDQVKRPKDKYWCDKCGTWRKKMIPEKRVLTEEPGF